MPESLGIVLPFASDETALHLLVLLFTCVYSIMKMSVFRVHYNVALTLNGVLTCRLSLKCFCVSLVPKVRDSLCGTLTYLHIGFFTP